MRKQLFYLSLTIVAIALSACSGGKKGVFGATSSGRAYEILVVVDPAMWERPAVGRFMMYLIRMYGASPVRTFFPYDVHFSCQL